MSTTARFSLADRQRLFHRALSRLPIAGKLSAIESDFMMMLGDLEFRGEQYQDAIEALDPDLRQGRSDELECVRLCISYAQSLQRVATDFNASPDAVFLQAMTAKERCALEKYDRRLKRFNELPRSEGARLPAQTDGHGAAEIPDNEVVVEQSDNDDVNLSNARLCPTPASPHRMALKQLVVLPILFPRTLTRYLWSLFKSYRRGSLLYRRHELLMAALPPAFVRVTSRK